jgi:hypothetical protein
LAGMEELFRSGSIDQNRSSANWPLAKALQRHGDAETGFKPEMGGVNHCSLHCRLAKIRGLMIKGNYSAVIG